MKKILLFAASTLFVMFGTIKSTEAYVEVAVVDPYNVVGEVFEFGDSGETIMNDMSSRKGLTCEPVNDEEYGKLIICSVDLSEEETDDYTFYFSDEELLYMVKVDLYYLGDAYTLNELFESVAGNFSDVEMIDHNEGNFYDHISEGTEIAACGEVPDRDYVACLTATAETDEIFPFVSVYYVFPDSVKAVDEG
jgi:hypothetical protein